MGVLDGNLVTLKMTLDPLFSIHFLILNADSLLLKTKRDNIMIDHNSNVGGNTAGK